MKKVIVIGSGGSGKSKFARTLGSMTGLPVVHLDRLYWKPGWTMTQKFDWENVVRAEIEKPKWIIDGNFGGTREMRMAAADTVVMLDLPRRVCIYRVLKRWLANRGQTRTDMGDGCPEKMDLAFLYWVWNFQNSSRPRALEEISRLSNKRVIVLRTQREVAEFLKDPYAN